MRACRQAGEGGADRGRRAAKGKVSLHAFSFLWLVHASRVTSVALNPLFVYQMLTG